MAYDAVQRMDSVGRLAMAGGGEAVSDPAANGEVCLRAYEKTKDGFFLEGARRMLDYLLHKAPRTADGIILHNDTSFFDGFSKYQLWIDGIYMVPPFLAVMGESEEAMKQIRGYLLHLYDTEAHVFYHIKDVKNDRFVRKVHWATGNGWALMGIARVIEEANRRSWEDVSKELTAFLLPFLDGMLKYRLPDGRFHDILDDDLSFADGTSAMMTAATIYRGVCGGYIPREYLPHADTAYRTVSKEIDGYGLIRHVSGCPDFVSEGTSAEAQAAFIMAGAWKKRI